MVSRSAGAALLLAGVGLIGGFADVRADSPEAPAVVVSIKPIHSLVAGVMQGVGTPTLLIEGAGSPHSYALRPSEARALDEADVVFWVGDGLETFLERPLVALSSDATVVALGDAQGLRLLPTRAGGTWAERRREITPTRMSMRTTRTTTMRMTTARSTCICGSIRTTPRRWSTRSRRR